MSRRKARPLEGFEQNDLQRDPTARPLQSLRFECLMDDTEYMLKWPLSALTRQLTGAVPMIATPPVERVVLPCSSSSSSSLVKRREHGVEVKKEEEKCEERLSDKTHRMDEEENLEEGALFPLEREWLSLLFGFVFAPLPPAAAAMESQQRWSDVSHLSMVWNWFAERNFVLSEAEDGTSVAAASPEPGTRQHVDYEPKCAVELSLSFRREVLRKLGVAVCNVRTWRDAEGLPSQAIESAEAFWRQSTALVEFLEDTAAAALQSFQKDRSEKAVAALTVGVPFRVAPHVRLGEVVQRAVYDVWVAARVCTSTPARCWGVPLAAEHFAVNPVFDEYFLPPGLDELPLEALFESGLAPTSSSKSATQGATQQQQQQQARSSVRTSASAGRALGSSFLFCGDMGLSAASANRRRGGASAALQWFLTEALPVELPWSKAIARSLGTRSRLKGWIQEQLCEEVEDTTTRTRTTDEEVVHTLRIKAKRERDEHDGGATTWGIDDLKQEVDDCRKLFGKKK